MPVPGGHWKLEHNCWCWRAAVLECLASPFLGQFAALRAVPTTLLPTSINQAVPLWYTRCGTGLQHYLSQLSAFLCGVGCSFLWPCMIRSLICGGCTSSLTGTSHLRQQLFLPWWPGCLLFSGRGDIWFCLPPYEGTRTGFEHRGSHPGSTGRRQQMCCLAIKSSFSLRPLYPNW